MPEITLIALFVIGVIGVRMAHGRWVQHFRWASVLAGMILIGFVFTAPLTIAQFISLLCGYWPDWRTNLYWYLLLGGIAGLTLIEGRNPYCGWFCPFGAYQICLGKLAGASRYRPRSLKGVFKWIQRGLALSAVVRIDF